MKVYAEVQPAWLGRGIRRIETAAKANLPAGVELTTDRRAAELVVVYAVGWPEVAEAVASDFHNGRRVALVQCCLRTTQRPHVRDWLPIWQECAAVWSYYDLDMLAREDGEHLRGVNFYHAPLGVDGDVFWPQVDDRTYAIGTSGYVAETEGVAECAEAARRVQKRAFHLGPQLIMDSHVDSREDITDLDVALAWSRCERVAGLRRIEGFELPALEGFACGARPVMFDAPHYRRWFGDHAEYVRETDSEALTNELARLLDEPPFPVSFDERQTVLRRFNWAKLVEGFWDTTLSEVAHVA